MKHNELPFNAHLYATNTDVKNAYDNLVSYKGELDWQTNIKPQLDAEYYAEHPEAKQSIEPDPFSTLEDCHHAEVNFRSAMEEYRNCLLNAFGLIDTEEPGSDTKYQPGWYIIKDIKKSNYSGGIILVLQPLADLYEQAVQQGMSSCHYLKLNDGVPYDLDDVIALDMNVFDIVKTPAGKNYKGFDMQGKLVAHITRKEETWLWLKRL